MIEFLENFHTESQCYSFLEDLRWWWDFSCLNCKSNEYWRHKRWYRTCKGCRRDIRVTAWTVLHWEKVPLRVVFLIAWYMVASKQWVSAIELSSILQENQKTVWTWLHKLRKVMILPNRNRLSGNVEVDEVFIWWTKSWKRGRWAEGKQKVVVAVEVNKDKMNKKWLIRWTWRTRMSVIPNCWQQTLKKFIVENIEQWSTLYTDKWDGYNNIESSGYSRIIQEETTSNAEVVGVDTIEVTPNVHIVASLLKRWLLGTHQQYLATHGYLQCYLDEYTFRYNRRKSNNRWKLFKTIMQQVISTPPTTFKDITEKHYRVAKKVEGVK